MPPLSQTLINKGCGPLFSGRPSRFLAMGSNHPSPSYTIHGLPVCETCRSNLELRSPVPLRMYENFLPTLLFGILHRLSCSDSICRSAHLHPGNRRLPSLGQLENEDGDSSDCSDRLTAINATHSPRIPKDGLLACVPGTHAFIYPVQGQAIRCRK